MIPPQLQHFSNDAFQSYYDRMIETRRLKNVVIFIQTKLYILFHSNDS